MKVTTAAVSLSDSTVSVRTVRVTSLTYLTYAMS